MKSSLDKLKETAKNNPTVVNRRYVDALERVVNDREKLKSLAEGLASGNAEKIREARETIAKEFANGILKHADKNSLPGKVLGKMMENIDTIKGASEALGKAAAGDPRPALKNADFPTNRLRITIDTRAPGWQQIDAVDLVGVPAE